MHNNSSIRVENLVKIYEPTPRWMRALARSNLRSPIRALDDISFQVSPGEICVVLGPNGAGKTTTFRILVGLNTPTSGGSRVVGCDPMTESVRVRRLVGWMPGDHRSLLMRHSVEENLRFHGNLQGLPNQRLSQAIRDVLKLVGLEGRASSTCFSLSSGMRARVQLARALLHRPKVLILDEPTGAVDPVASSEIVDLILDIVAEQEIAALISSHRLEEVERLDSRVLLLDDGKLRYDGSVKRLRDMYAASRLRIVFRSAESAQEAELALKRTPLGEIQLDDHMQLYCILAPGVKVANVLETLGDHSENITSLQEVQPPLHEVMASIYGNGRKRAETRSGDAS